MPRGNKVNSALDNPTNFFTSKRAHQSRASDLNSLMDSMSNGIQTLAAADNGLTSITKTLESMQSTLRQARQDKSFLRPNRSTYAKIDPNADHHQAVSPLIGLAAVGNPKSFDMVVEAAAFATGDC